MSLAVCRCFYTRNIYLKELHGHVVYHDTKQFLREYEQILNGNGYTSAEKRQEILRKIEKEVTRRRNLGSDYLQRRRVIKETYKPLHPHLYTLKDSYFDGDFLKLVQYCNTEDSSFEGIVDYLQETHISRLYAFPVFTEEFCQQFVEELEHFETSDCPKGRPNTMNNYGINLNEMGFDNFITSLRMQYIQPISRLLYPDWGGDSLDSHKAFIVQYKVDEDLDLSYHYDNAEVTLNVALSPTESYEGGNLYFGDMRNVSISEDEYKEYSHQPCKGIIHRGQHKHGALPITSGIRYNLIIWMRSSAVRNKLCPMCDNIPDLVETQGLGDGFTLQQKTVDVCSTT